MTFLGLRPSVFCLFFLGFPLFWLLWIGLFALYPGPSSPDTRVDVVIPSRTSIAEIEQILIDSRIIRDDPRFLMLATITGAANKLRAGEYRFETGLKPLHILRLLRRGKVLYRPVTIPEGTEILGISDILETGGWIDRARFSELARDPEFLEKMSVTADNLEGYLFPDTYYLSRGQQNESEILRMMVARHFEIYDKLTREITAVPHGLTHHEIITLAAIVEKETGIADERPLVADVFLNRLQKGMRLQADPTVRYGLPGRNGPLRRSDLKNPTPYNTYVIKGLPPGPITNPGEAAIRAVLYPAGTDYLYFVLKDDRSHHFSRTLREHNRAVADYRKK